MKVESWSVRISPDGKNIATGSHSGTVNIFSIEEKAKKASVETKGKFIMKVVYSSDGRTLAAATQGGQVHLIDVESLKVQQALEGGF
jgi:WD40 repeat protein